MSEARASRNRRQALWEENLTLREKKIRVNGRGMAEPKILSSIKLDPAEYARLLALQSHLQALSGRSVTISHVWRQALDALAKAESGRGFDIEL